MVKTLKLKDNFAVLLTDETQRMYFTGFKSSFGYVIVTKTKTAFFTDKRYAYAAENNLKVKGIEVFVFSGLDEIKKYLTELGIKTIGIDYTLTTVDEFKSLKALGFKFKDVSEKLNKLFAVKNPEEIKLIKKACFIAEKSFYEILPFVKKGITEKQLANELEYAMLKNGAEKTSFDTIVAFGANSAVPHHETGDTVLTENQPVLIDFGCKVGGYCSDCTRTFFFGEPTEEFVNAYEATLKANIEAENKVTCGMTCKQADAVARDVLGSYGLADAFTHSLGHGIGINIHEYPYLSPKRGDAVLKNKMVFSIEPGVYFDGKFGIRIEDTVTLSGGKIKRLFNDDKNLIKINI